MEQKTVTLKDSKGRTISMPVNYQDFILTNSSSAEDHGLDEEDVKYMLTCLKEGHIEDIDMNDETMNVIGIIFEEGVCTKPDINKAVYWYEQAVANNNDLARSNLADILRKGSQGYPKNLEKAFQLYKECGLPYAHYRVGEFYEHGWGVKADLEKAKVYYRQAYKEGHGLARKKLKEFDFLK